MNTNINININTSVDSSYPPKEYIYRVFQMPLENIKIVLLGQDPYHGPNQANGLSFSVNTGIRIPPSLLNIFKELKQEFPERNYEFLHGNLEKWIEQGIFLLNCSLTVKPGQPGSHMSVWKSFTDDIIKYISEQNTSCVFLLLGNFAKSKQVFIKNKERCILGIHPSPLARGFLGSGIFKKVEEKLNTEIDWSI